MLRACGSMLMCLCGCGCVCFGTFTQYKYTKMCARTSKQWRGNRRRKCVESKSACRVFSKWISFKQQWHKKESIWKKKEECSSNSSSSSNRDSAYNSVNELRRFWWTYRVKFTSFGNTPAWIKQWRHFRSCHGNLSFFFFVSFFHSFSRSLSLTLYLSVTASTIANQIQIHIFCVYLFNSLCSSKMLHQIDDIIASPKRQMGKIFHIHRCVWWIKCLNVNIYSCWMGKQSKKHSKRHRVCALEHLQYTLNNNCWLGEVIECIDSSVNNSFLHCRIFRILHCINEALKQSWCHWKSSIHSQIIYIHCGKIESQKNMK